MYALTREGRKPPMVHVRQSLYSLLEPKKKKGNVVNLLGFFSPLMDDCELYGMLGKAGVKTVHEISRCKNYDRISDDGGGEFQSGITSRNEIRSRRFS